MRTIVIGVGNPLRGDDAVGLHVARGLETALAGNQNIEVTEVWAGGLRLAEATVGYDHAIIIDALVTGQHAPGTLVIVSSDSLDTCRTVTCAHDTSLPTALAFLRAAGADLPSNITVFGVETRPPDMEVCEKLSDLVHDALPSLVHRVLAKIRSDQPQAENAR